MSDQVRKLLEAANSALPSPERQAEIRADAERIVAKLLDLAPEERSFVLEKLAEHFNAVFGYWPSIGAGR